MAVKQQQPEQPEKPKRSSAQRILEDILTRAFSNPSGLEKLDVFRELTQNTAIPIPDQYQQYALNNLGPDTVTKKMKLASGINEEALNSLLALNPQSQFIKALITGIR